MHPEMPYKLISALHDLLAAEAAVGFSACLLPQPNAWTMTSRGNNELQCLIVTMTENGYICTCSTAKTSNPIKVLSA